MLSRIFQRDKAMVIVRLARRAQRLVADCIITGATRAVIVGGAATAPDRAASVQIQAKLDAARAKAFRPIERLAGFEIVPFDADALILEATIELLPAVPHIRPGHLLEVLSFHRVIFGVSAQIARLDCRVRCPGGYYQGPLGTAE